MHHYVLNSVPGDHPSQAEALSIIESVNESLKANKKSFSEADWDADYDTVLWKLDEMAYDVIPEHLKMLERGKDFVDGGGMSWDIESAFYAGQMVDKATWVLFQLLKLDDGLGWRFEHVADVSDPALVFADLGSVFAKWLSVEDDTTSESDPAQKIDSIGEDHAENEDDPGFQKTKILDHFTYESWIAAHGQPTTEGMTDEESEALAEMTIEQRNAFCQVLQKMCEEPPSTWREEMKNVLVIFIRDWFGLEDERLKSGNLEDDNSLSHQLNSLTESQKGILTRTIINFHHLGEVVGDDRFREVGALLPPISVVPRMSGRPPFSYDCFY